MSRTSSIVYVIITVVAAICFWAAIDLVAFPRFVNKQKGDFDRIATALERMAVAEENQR